MTKLTRLCVPLILVVSLAVQIAAARTLDNSVHPIGVADPETLPAGSATNGTVTVDNAGTTSTVIYLSSSNTEAVTVPASVTMPAGQTTVDFTITGVTADETASVTATANGEEATGRVIKVNAETPR